MDVLPAIDIRDGKVVRLLRGDYARQTTYSLDPADVARQFAAGGASWIHVVDLDAARSGRATNGEAINAIRKAVDVRIEMGGGIRSEAVIEERLADGIDRVVIGSAAVKNQPWFEELLARRHELAPKIALGLDARDGKLSAQGWTEQLSGTAVDFAARVAGSGLGAIVYTDIARDGTLEGVNIPATKELVEATDVPVIASGGVKSVEDVVLCRQAGCSGVIIGKAYYEGRIDISRAIAAAGRASGQENP